MALPGLFKYFKDCSDEERGHAEKLMEYQNKRGGKIVLMDVEAPEKQEWNSICEAMNSALELEKRVNDVSILLSKNGTFKNCSSLGADLAQYACAQSIYRLCQKHGRFSWQSPKTRTLLLLNLKNAYYFATAVSCLFV